MAAKSRVFVIGLFATGILVLTLPGARAATVVVVNPSFELGPLTHRDWQIDTSEGTGSFYVNDDTAKSGAYSAVLLPSAFQIGAMQQLDHGEVVGRTVTVSGWRYSSSLNRGLKAQVECPGSSGHIPVSFKQHHPVRS